MHSQCIYKNRIFHVYFFFIVVSITLNLAYDENVPSDVKEDLKELVRKKIEYFLFFKTIYDYLLRTLLIKTEC